MHCLEAGKTPTTVNLARECGISRVAVWKLQQRWPWLDAWCDELMMQANAHYWGAIERRMALTALQGGGSTAHAEQYCRMRGFRNGPGGESGAPGAVSNTVQVNLLMPRPEYPQAQPEVAAQVRLPPPDLPTRPVPVLGGR